MAEIEASLQSLFEQAPMTAATYFDKAKEILHGSEMEYTTSDVVALAQVMASDLQTSLVSKVIEKGLTEVSDALGLER